MISQTAIATLEEFEAKGLHPTPRDVVRLNAIGLKLEASRGKHAATSTYLLPRVAAVSETLSFRQPTIGHEIWMQSVDRFIAPGDYQSMLAVRAFALSRPQSELPDPADPQSVKMAVDAFCRDCRDLTRDQIYAALNYVMYGCDPTVGESSAKRDEDEPDEDSPDFTECIALGVLNEGRAVLWGITEADMRNMTARQLSDVIDRATYYHKVEQGEVDWEGRYYATADEIEERLTSLRSPFPVPHSLTDPNRP